MSKIHGEEICKNCKRSKIDYIHRLDHTLYAICEDGYTPRKTSYCKFFKDKMEEELQ